MADPVRRASLTSPFRSLSKITLKDIAKVKRRKDTEMRRGGTEVGGFFSLTSSPSELLVWKISATPPVDMPTMRPASSAFVADARPASMQPALSAVQECYVFLKKKKKGMMDGATGGGS